MNEDLKRLIRSRDKLKKAAVKSKSLVLMSSYRHIRNKINKQTSELKRQYFSERLAQAKGNMKESWKTINQVVNRRSKSTNIDLLKGPGGEIVNKQEISYTMNDNFCSVGKDLASKIEDAPNPMLTGLIFFIDVIKILQYILRSTLLTRITLQYYWDKNPRGARGYVYPKGINIDKRKKTT